MGQKSTKENKNIYFQSRENAGLTREKASELLEFISTDRIDRIENRGAIPHPDEILAMARHYKNPGLCNYFCSHECQIGEACVPEVKLNSLPAITLEMIATLNNLEKEKDRIIEITYDGKITDDEMADFKRIQGDLDHMSLVINTLKLWVDNTVLTGELDNSILEKL